MLAGRMLASSFSERWYSDSIAASARSISRSANHTVANTITVEDTVEVMKPTVSAHGGREAAVVGRQELQRDRTRHAHRDQDRRQHQSLDPEHQHHQRRRHQEVELQAGIGADGEADEPDRQVGEEEERQRCDQRTEPVQRRDSHEDRRGHQVHQAERPELAAEGQLEEPEEGRHGRGDVRRDREHPQPAEHALRVVLGAGRHATLAGHVRHADRPPELADRHGRSVSPQATRVGALGEIRTHTGRVLNPFPLPVGIRGPGGLPR